MKWHPRPLWLEVDIRYVQAFHFKWWNHLVKMLAVLQLVKNGQHGRNYCGVRKGWSAIWLGLKYLNKCLHSTLIDWRCKNALRHPTVHCFWPLFPPGRCSVTQVAVYCSTSSHRKLLTLISEGLGKPRPSQCTGAVKLSIPATLNWQRKTTCQHQTTAVHGERLLPQLQPEFVYMKYVSIIKISLCLICFLLSI